MTKFEDLDVFARVVSLGSMSMAGRALNLSPAVVSKRIKRLEDRLGTRLLQRTTRQISLTEAGQGFYERVLSILAGIDEAESYVSGRSARIQGMLKVTAPTSFGRMHVAPHLKPFLETHPDLSLGVAVNAASFASLPQREADIGLRLCRPEHGNFVVRRIGTIAFGLYGSRDYVERHPVIEDVLPITGRRLIAWGDTQSFLALPKALRAWAQIGSTTLTVDSMQAQLLAMKSGSGLGVLPCILGDGDDQLVRIKPALCHREEPIWLVVHETIRHTSRVHVVCDFLETLVAANRAGLTGMTG